jgi:hypothetical protein
MLLSFEIASMLFKNLFRGSAIFNFLVDIIIISLSFLDTLYQPINRRCCDCEEQTTNNQRNNQSS